MNTSNVRAIFYTNIIKDVGVVFFYLKPKFGGFVPNYGVDFETVIKFYIKPSSNPK